LLAALTLEPELLLAFLGVVVAGWGISRSGAVAGWKSVAEARKERIEEIEGTQARAEEREAALANRVAELEALPNVAELADLVSARHDAVMACLHELKEALNAIAERQG
jgi:hypothetical protein